MLIKNIQELEKVVNSELTSKILESTISFDELMIDVSSSNLIDIIQFLKIDETCKFRQL